MRQLEDLLALPLLHLVGGDRRAVLDDAGVRQHHRQRGEEHLVRRRGTLSTRNASCDARARHRVERRDERDDVADRVRRVHEAVIERHRRRRRRAAAARRGLCDSSSFLVSASYSLWYLASVDGGVLRRRTASASRASSASMRACALGVELRAQLGGAWPAAMPNGVSIRPHALQPIAPRVPSCRRGSRRSLASAGRMRQRLLEALASSTDRAGDRSSSSRCRGCRSPAASRGTCSAGGADRSRGSARARRTRRARDRRRAASRCARARRSTSVRTVGERLVVELVGLDAGEADVDRLALIGRRSYDHTALAPMSIARVLLSISFLYSVVLSSPANASRNRPSSVRSVASSVACRRPREHHRARVRRRRVRIVDDLRSCPAAARRRLRQIGLASSPCRLRPASLSRICGGVIEHARRASSSTGTRAIMPMFARWYARVVERADVLRRHRANRRRDSRRSRARADASRRRRGARRRATGSVSGAS